MNEDKPQAPSKDQLEKLFNYDHSTGALLNRAGKYIDGEAGHFDATTGYRRVSINNKKYYTHRVIWAMLHGEWPEGQIDHVNHNKVDNRISNLRLCSHKDNGRNQKKASNNTSGVTGVYWDNRYSRWMAAIMIDGINKFLGYFEDKEEAAQCRKRAEVEHGFHSNHGV